MRSKLSAVLLLTLALGCEHKKSEPKAPPSGSAAPTKDQGGGGGATTPPAAEVRAPTKDDLELYTKDIPGTGKLTAKFETSMGTITCELFPEKAPITVANFVGLATGKKAWRHPETKQVETNKPFFDGLIFHRVIPEFMIQGGDPLGEGVGGPGYKFEDETGPSDQMTPGTLAMANAGPATNGSQFFITEVAPSHLNGRHTIFGQCKELDIVKQIARVPSSNDKPNTPVTMKVTISKG